MSRHQRGRGTARRHKEQALGLVPGLSKPTLDLLNRESHRRYQLGIGVLVQEEDRSRKLLASVQREASGKPLGGWRMRRVLRAAREEHAFWKDRLRAVVDTVAGDVSHAELDRFVNRL